MPAAGHGAVAVMRGIMTSPAIRRGPGRRCPSRYAGGAGGAPRRRAAPMLVFILGFGSGVRPVVGAVKLGINITAVGGSLPRIDLVGH